MKISRKSILGVASALVLGSTLSVSSPALATDILTTGTYTVCLPTIDSTTITVSNSTPGDHLVWTFSHFTNLGSWFTEPIPGKYVDLGPAVDGEYTLTNESAQALATQAGVTEWPFEINLGSFAGSFGPSDTLSNYDYVAVGLNDTTNPYTECTQPVAPAADELPDTGINAEKSAFGILAGFAVIGTGIVALVVVRRRLSAK